MPDYDAIFAVEMHVEAAFKTLLLNACGRVYTSREKATQDSPYIRIKCLSKGVREHRHILGGVNVVNDAWTGILETEIATNRETDNDAHAQLIGVVRARLQWFQILPAWPSKAIILAQDIYEGETTDSFVNEDCLDMTFIQWIINWNIHPDAWN